MNRFTRFVAMGGMAVAAFLWGTAQGAVYDASTGYVTLLVNGSTATDSPMSTTKAEDSASTASNRKYFWSDHLPMHAGTNYYVNTWFRTVIETTATTSNHHVFPGGKFQFDVVSFLPLIEIERVEAACFRLFHVHCLSVGFWQILSIRATLLWDGIVDPL